MAGDWLKLHRKIADSAVMSDDWLCRLWIHCLTRANWRTGFFKGYTIPPGSFAAASEIMAEKLNVSRGKLRRGLEKLEELDQITLKSTNRFTIVTICNWQTYQDEETQERPTSGQPAANQRPTNGTTGGQQTVQQPATIEERKEIKEGEEVKKDKKKTTATMPAIPENLLGEAFSQLWGQWETHRREIKKPLTPTAAGQQLAKLSAMGPERAAAALRHSIANGWQGIFEPEAEAANGRKPRIYSADNPFA